MNAQSRSLRDMIIDQLEYIINSLYTLKSEEQDDFLILGQNLQESELGYRITHNICSIEGIIKELENQKGELEEVD